MRIASRHRIGMLLLWDPAVAVEGGIRLDGVVTRELLVCLTVPEHINSISQGAVVIRGDCVARAGVPLTWMEVIERGAELAVGVALAVDDNSGEIRIADRTGRVEVVDADELADVLRRHELEAGRR